MESVVALQDRRRRLSKRLDDVQREQNYGVFRGDPDEPVKLKRAIARIGKRLKNAKEG